MSLALSGTRQPRLVAAGRTCFRRRGLMLPIAVAAAPAAGIDPVGMALAVAMSGSASFLTPIGYQTNTMVYGPGGYRLSDYFKLGFPITAMVVGTLILVIPVVYGV